jgi:anaerobic C4-dicarboxylate transporter
MPATSPPPDPTLKRRAQIARLTEMGQRVGYGLFGVAIVAFAIGAAAGFSGVDVFVVIACLAAGSAVLAPAIVFGYAVKAAEREDRQREDRQRAARRPGPRA